MLTVDNLQMNEPDEAPRKHSGLGIASFVLAISVLVLTFVLVVIAGVMEASTPGGMDEESPELIVVGLAIIGMVVLNVVAFGLGIGGMFQKDRKKLYAVLGMSFATLTVIGTIALILFGLSIEAGGG